MKSADGGEIKEDYSWDFSTQRPQVKYVSPKDGYNYMSKTPEIKLYFNQMIPLNAQNVAKFHLVSGLSSNSEAEIPITLYKFDTTKTDPTIDYYDYGSQPNADDIQYGLIVKPKVLLEGQTPYLLTIDEGLNSTYGPNGLEVPYQYGFVTIGQPGVIGSMPVDGATAVKETYGMTFTFKTPMNNDSFKGNVLITPSPKNGYTTYFSEYNNQLNLNFDMSRSTNYTVTITGNVKDKYGTLLGQNYTVKFETAAYEPSVSIQPNGTYFASFYSEAKSVIGAKVTNADSLRYSLYKLSEPQFLDLYRLKYSSNYGNIINSELADGICRSVSNCSNWQDIDVSKLDLVKTWNQYLDLDFNVPSNVYEIISDKGNSALDPGLYFLELSIPQGAKDNMVMVVTKSSIMVKKSSEQIFAWVVDQSSGNPREGYNLRLVDINGNEIKSGRTNSDGVWQDKTKFPGDPYSSDFLVFGTGSGNDTIVNALMWKQGIEPYDFGISSNYWYDANSKYNIYLTTDRPLYRPGQKVFYKGVIREANDGLYKPVPEGSTASVAIAYEGNHVQTIDAYVNSFGGFSGEYVLPDTNVGYYKLEVSYNGEKYPINSGFNVEEYKRPEFYLSMEPDRESYAHGDTAKIEAQAKYYFGNSLPNAKITWETRRNNYIFTWDKDYRYSFTNVNDWYYGFGGYGDGGYGYNNYSYGEKVTGGVTNADSSGNATISVPLNISQQDTSQLFYTEAFSKDESNQQAVGNTEFVVHKGDYYVGIKSESYWAIVGEPAQLTAVAVDYSGREIPSVELKINVYSRKYKEVREKSEEDGMYYYVTKHDDTLVFTQKGETNEYGYFSADFAPEKGGSYLIEVRSKDSKGRTIVASSSLWVSGEGFEAPRQNHDRILLSTDKMDYKKDEQIKTLVATPYSVPTKAIYTVEKDGVYDYFVRNVDSANNTFSLTAKGEYVPNVFISTYLFKPWSEQKSPAEYKIGYAKALIYDPANKIEVSIVSDKSEYQPNDKVKLTVNTKDGNGKAVKAELALSVVDKALLDLSGQGYSDIYKQYYSERPLKVETSTLMTISMDRINANVNLGAKGGSGGGGGGESAFDTTRKDFPETSYWNGHVVTDSSGSAQVEFTLPDNLTTWKATAIGVSAQNGFGQSDTEFITTKKLLVRPLLPRFFGGGDNGEFGLIVVNSLTKGVNAKVGLKSELLNLDLSKSVYVGPNSQSKVVWKTSIPKQNGDAVVLLTAEGEGYRDAASYTIPLMLRYSPQSVASSGKIDGTVSEFVKVPQDSSIDQGGLDVQVSSVLGATILSTTRDLSYYPYLCMEQTASILRAVAGVYGIMQTLKVQDLWGLNTDLLKTNANNMIARLTRYQNADGGWGWWDQGLSVPFISAYDYDALMIAKTNGLFVSDDVLNKAKSYLFGVLSNSTVDNNVKAYAVYALSKDSQNHKQLASYNNSLFENRSSLNIESLALLGISINTVSGRDSMVNRIYDEIVSQVKKDSTTSHWEDSSELYSYSMGSDAATTASVVEFLSKADKNNPLIYEAVRYLNNTREQGYYGYSWGSTRTDATVINALDSVVQNSLGNGVKNKFKVELNKKSILEGEFTKENITQLFTDFTPISELNKGQDNPLVISKDGGGDLFYNSTFTYYLPSDQIKSEDRGITIVREIYDLNGKEIKNNTLQAGEEYLVRLTVVSPVNRKYLMIEDPLPSGVESQNTVLKSTRTLTAENVPTGQGNNYYWDIFGKKEFRDDRTVMFADNFYKGLYQTAYRIRAIYPGTYQYPPARVSEMYTPEVFGDTAGNQLKITVPGESYGIVGE